MTAATTKAWHPVTSRTFTFHKTSKKSDLPSVKVSHETDIGTVKEWILCEHSGYARQRATKFWVRHGGTLPVPRSVEDFLARASDLHGTAEILIEVGGKYPFIIDHRAAQPKAA